MGILQTPSSANWLDGGGEHQFYRLSESSKPALSVSVLRIPQMADSTEREVYLLILRGIRTRQCCLEIWTIPLKIFNPFISRQPRISPSRPNRGMKGLAWLDASCAVVLTSESWIEDTKYCPIIAPPFGNSFVQFLYRSCMGFAFWIISTFPTQIDRLLLDQVVLFAALLSPAISLLPYYIQVLIVTTTMHGDSRVITLHENSSPILIARVTIFSW